MGNIYNLPATHKPLELTIGEGRVGLKTLTLRADRRYIEKYFCYPDHIALTPGFFDRFLWECGAIGAKSSMEKGVKTSRGQFTPQESMSIREAVMSLDPEIRYALFIRSDDYPIGIGLEASYPTCAPIELRGKREGDELLLRRVENKIKWVLESQFNSNAQAFKRLKGITGRSGVQVMPFIGDELIELNVATTVLSANILGPINGSYLTSVGYGIGGANSDFADIYLSKIPKVINIAREDVSEYMKYECLDFVTGDVTSGGIREIILEMNDYTLMQMHYGNIDETIMEFLREAGPRWIELVKASWERPYWVVVQSAPVDYKPIERPEIDKKRILFETFKCCCGSGVVESDKLVFTKHGIADSNVHEDLEKNKENERYILVVDSEHGANFLKYLVMRDMPNVAGVIILADEIKRLFQSHLNGWLRESGILVIGIEANEERKKQLIEKLKNGGKITIYCNEFVNDGEGFVALKSNQ